MIRSVSLSSRILDIDSIRVSGTAPGVGGLDRWEERMSNCYRLDLKGKRFGAVSLSERGRRTINVQWKRDCGAFGPLGRMQNQ